MCACEKGGFLISHSPSECFTSVVVAAFSLYAGLLISLVVPVWVMGRRLFYFFFLLLHVPLIFLVLFFSSLLFPSLCTTPPHFHPTLLLGK